MTKTIAICNQKGGTGKTTTAINLSVAMSMLGKKILLVDIDSQANATSGLGIDKKKIDNSVYNVLVDNLAIRDVIMSKLDIKMSILPSSPDLAGAEIELVPLLNREYRLKKALEVVIPEFDFIFIDCPPSLGLLTINALTAANSIIIPVQCEYYALEGLTQLLNTITLVRNNINPNLEIEGVLLTMADYRTNLTQEVISEIRSYFKEKAYQTVIPRNIRITEAPSFGKPIFLYDKDSIGAKKYWELACEVLKIDNTQLIENNIVKNIEIPKNAQSAKLTSEERILENNKQMNLLGRNPEVSLNDSDARRNHLRASPPV